MPEIRKQAGDKKEVIFFINGGLDVFIIKKNFPYPLTYKKRIRKIQATTVIQTTTDLFPDIA